jgi:iron complex outermembrane receptor protein
LAAAVADRSLAGKVTDVGGASVPETRVLVRGVVNRETATDISGDFLVQGLPAGTYEVIAEKSGFTVLKRTVTLGGEETQVRFVLEPATILQVMEVSGAPELAGEAVMKLAATLHETPRATSVYNADELRERNVRSVPELLAFVPGMSPNSYRNGSYHFYARGFRMLPADTRVDGFTGINLGGGGFGASMFGIEQAVVLRGPAGLQYGATGSPGGFINLVTKKPQPIRSTRLDLRGGWYGGGGVAASERPSLSFDFDSTGAVTGGGRILYRTLATVERNNYFTRDVLDKAQYYHGSLTFKIDPLGLYSLTPIFQYSVTRRPTGGGLVASPTTSLTTNDGSLGPINSADLSPHDVNLSTGFQNNLARQAGFDFRAAPAQAWAVNLAYRAISFDRHINQFTPQVTTPAQIELLRTSYLVNRAQSKSESDNRYHNVDFHTAYEFRGSSWKSTVQAGAYTLVTNARSTSALGTVPGAGYPIHIYTGAGPTPLDRYPALRFNPFQATTNWNGFLQNRTSLFGNRLVLSAGLGYGQSHPAGARVRKGDLLPNFAAVFNLTSLVALYGSYATSFNPVDPTLQDVNGQLGTFQPTIGDNYEFGTKFDLPNRRASATLSFFRNGIDNALVQTGVNDVNVNGVRYYVEAGTRRGKGAELTTDFRLRRDLFISAAVSYTDAIYTGNGPASAASTLAIPGSKAEKTPKWAWNSRLHWERSEGRLAGFGASLAILWQDERLGSNGARTLAAPDPLLLPAYTRVDTSLFYRFNRHTDLALNMENLADRKIFVNATTGSSMEMAAPRTATIRWSYRF